jgi:hypothetical protein
MPQSPLTTSQRRRIEPLRKFLARRVKGPEQILDIVAGILAAPDQAHSTIEARRSTVEYRGVKAVERIAWRDALLDQLVVALANNQDTADLSQRLGRYLKIARGHEAYSARDWTGGARKNLMDWIERLPEMPRKRPDSIYRPPRSAYEYLAGLFHDARAELARRGVKTRPADWRPIVRNAWMDERAGGWVDKRQQQHIITDAQADAIAVTPSGRIRAPKAMALEMVATLLGRDPQWLKRRLYRVRLGPPAL